MPTCENCRALVGAPSAELPHAALSQTRRVDLGRASHGQAKGEFVYFECGDCGALLLRDLDEKDPEQQWGLARSGA